MTEAATVGAVGSNNWTRQQLYDANIFFGMTTKWKEHVMPTAQEYASFFIDLETIPLSSCVSSKKNKRKEWWLFMGLSMFFAQLLKYFFDKNEPLLENSLQVSSPDYG